MVKLCFAIISSARKRLTWVRRKDELPLPKRMRAQTKQDKCPAGFFIFRGVRLLMSDHGAIATKNAALPYGQKTRTH